MARQTKAASPVRTAAGQRLIRSVRQAIAWAGGEDVPVRVAMVKVERTPAADVRSVREGLGD